MRACAFCGANARLSGEHIWSAWVGKLYGRPTPRRFTFRQMDRDGRVVRTWRSRDIDMTAKVVCEGCNNGWMSDLENN